MAGTSHNVAPTGVPSNAVQLREFGEQISLFDCRMSAAAFVKFMRSDRNVAEMCASNEIVLKRATTSHREDEQQKWNLVFAQHLIQCCAFLEAHCILFSVQDKEMDSMLALAVRAGSARQVRACLTTSSTHQGSLTVQELEVVASV